MKLLRVGRWLVTSDEVADPQNLKMWLEVDGERYQNGSTRTMIFGVGMGVKPEPVRLKPGNVMHLSIEGLGEQTQNVRAYSAG